MAIKYNWQDLQKRMYNGQEVQKVMYNWNQIRPSVTPTYDYLNFTAVDGDVDIKLRWPINLTPPAINFEVSWDRESWIDYTLWDNITVLEWRTLYWRNKSDTPDWESGWAGFFSFYMSWTWKVEAHGSVMYLLCKIHSLVISFNSAFYYLFRDCDKLITAPELPATTLSRWCYNSMFQRCSSLVTASSLQATTLTPSCYYAMFEFCTSLTTLPKIPTEAFLEDFCCRDMFFGCSNIKMSTRQIWDYQIPYTLPSTWTSTGLYQMFSDTWWSFTWTPIHGGTYYTSNQVI